MLDYEIRYRRLSELGIDGDLVSSRLRDVLAKNPFRGGKDVMARKVAIVDGKVAGHEDIFPLQAFVFGTKYEAGSGSSTTIEPWARKSGIGLVISDFDGEGRDGCNPLSTAGALSQVAIKVHRFMGYTVFEFPRFIFPLKSRSVMESKLKGVLLCIASRLVDCGISLCSFVVGCISRYKIRD